MRKHSFILEVVLLRLFGFRLALTWRVPSIQGQDSASELLISSTGCLQWCSPYHVVREYSRDSLVKNAVNTRGLLSSRFIFNGALKPVVS